MALAWTLLVAGVVGRGCPEYKIPTAPSEVGVETRSCFFGSQQAADNALREAAKQAECYTDNQEPPGCVCPPALPAGTELCQSWAVNLVRLYAYSPAEESAFVHDLSSRLADRCRTSGGVLLAPGAGAGIEPDGMSPACSQAAPAKTADLAVFTAYMVVLTTSFVFVVLENQLSVFPAAGKSQI